MPQTMMIEVREKDLPTVPTGSVTYERAPDLASTYVIPVVAAEDEAEPQDGQTSER